MSLELARNLADLTVQYEGGTAAPYSAINADGEYEGLFDLPKKDARGNKLLPSQRVNQPDWKPHSASRYTKNGGYHIGISFGAWQFTQDAGSLGKVLARFHQKDRDAFNQIFGGERLATQLLAMTNRSGDRPPAHPGGARSPRVQPLGGADLWQEPWVARFREAGRHPKMREAQLEQMMFGYMRPALDTMRARGFSKPSSLAVLFDVAIQYGKSGMQGRVAKLSGSEDEVIDKLISGLEPNRQARRRNIRAAAKKYDSQSIPASLSVPAPPSVNTNIPMPDLGTAASVTTQQMDITGGGASALGSWLSGLLKPSDAAPAPDSPPSHALSDASPAEGEGWGVSGWADGIKSFFGRMAAQAGAQDSAPPALLPDMIGEDSAPEAESLSLSPPTMPVWLITVIVVLLAWIVWRWFGR